ncbi:hepatoma-derived growth factor-related protein 2 [Cocos nucifera]|uniref:Hepatoma-derived growth factor-related protein 2 n=1 Tax=Cocos nucifera TaxID=13894 RepID=A0A8K0I8Z8_COCNU|nr:hepatoma-derived growth factor-related protein 2 [Cocos nucifera]
MEPADIDWKNIESKYVRDDIYERINAPKWIDLANPDASPVDDEAWFCRPDCRHPKTVEDFQRWTPSPKVKHVRSSSEMLPLGEKNGNQREGNYLKRRGIAAFLPSSPLREPLKPKAAAPKKFRHEGENQNPNISTPPTSRQFGAPRGGKAAKEMIKSSTEKKVGEEREEWQQQKKPQPRLKSTLSARNLFSGKDILSQISEFCQELKKLAVRSERPDAQEEANKEVKKVSEAAPEEVAEKREEGKTDQDLNSKRNDVSEKKSGKRPMRIEIGEHKYKKGLDENSSVLRERGILQELEQSREEKRELAANGEDSNGTSVASDSERSSMNMFWFLKPCTYLHLAEAYYLIWNRGIDSTSEQPAYPDFSLFISIEALLLTHTGSEGSRAFQLEAFWFNGQSSMEMVTKKEMVALEKFLSVHI